MQLDPSPAYEYYKCGLSDKIAAQRVSKLLNERVGVVQSRSAMAPLATLVHVYDVPRRHLQRLLCKTFPSHPQVAFMYVAKALPLVHANCQIPGQSCAQTHKIAVERIL